MWVGVAVRRGQVVASRPASGHGDVWTLLLAFELPQVFRPASPPKNERAIGELAGLGLLVVPCCRLLVVTLEVFQRFCSRFLEEVFGDGLLFGVSIHLDPEDRLLASSWEMASSLNKRRNGVNPVALVADVRWPQRMPRSSSAQVPGRSPKMRFLSTEKMSPFACS